MAGHLHEKFTSICIAKSHDKPNNDNMQLHNFVYVGKNHGNTVYVIPTCPSVLHEVFVVNTHRKMIVYSRGLTVNGDPFNKRFTVTIHYKGLSLNIEQEDVVEEWWGNKIDPYTLLRFGLLNANPYNIDVHHLLKPPEYAGEYIWICKGNPQQKFFIKSEETWIPVTKIGPMDGKFFPKCVREELNLIDLS